VKREWRDIPELLDEEVRGRDTCVTGLGGGAELCGRWACWVVGYVCTTHVGELEDGVEGLPGLHDGKVCILGEGGG
jgi:hypothetical protein